MKQKSKIDKKPLIIGLIGGFIAALCCITPLAIVFFGLGSVSVALGLSKYGYVFFTLGLIFIGIALWIYYKKKNKSCSLEDKKKQKYYIIATIILMVLIFIIVKYWLLNLIAPYVYG